jgi:hypothetical protein
VIAPPNKRLRAAFYCVSSGEYFLGAVAMVNSLRLVGHTEPIFLLDCGLTSAQRALLAQEVTVVPAPSDAPPFMLKAFAPLAYPADVAILIDVDMIAARALTPLIEKVSEGRLIAPDVGLDRFFAEWGELLGLGRARRGPYLTSGLVFLGGAVRGEVLGLLSDCGVRVDLERTFLGTEAPDYPFHYADQDLLNAIVATRVAPDRVIPLDRRLVAEIPFQNLAVVDQRSLRCAYDDGTEPYVVHHVLDAKPWLEPTPGGVYSRLLQRTLAGPGLAMRVPPTQVPLRLRTGLRAQVERKRVNAWVRLRSHAGGGLPSQLRTMRDRLTSGRT